MLSSDNLRNGPPRGCWPLHLLAHLLQGPHARRPTLGPQFRAQPAQPTGLNSDTFHLSTGASDLTLSAFSLKPQGSPLAGLASAKEQSDQHHAGAGPTPAWAWRGAAASAGRDGPAPCQREALKSRVFYFFYFILFF